MILRSDGNGSVRRRPTHQDLPDSDGVPTDQQFLIGSNNGLYWRETDPPLDGCESPDWFYIPGVHGSLVDGELRNSYVLGRNWCPQKS